MMLLRHYVVKYNNFWMAFDETEASIGMYATRRGALKRVSNHFKSVDVHQLRRNMGI